MDFFKIRGPRIIEWPNPIYKMDGYFKFVASFYKELEVSLPTEKKNYIDFIDLLDQYSQILDRFKSCFATETPDENFCTPIHVGEEEIGNYYSVAWDIKKANDWVHTHEKTPLLIATEKLHNENRIIVTDQLIKNMEDKIHEPIHVAIYPPSNSLVVIDGNHRLYIHSLRKKTKIKAFIFDPAEHLQLMTDNLSQVSYYIHHNIVVLMNYYLGLIDTVYSDNETDYWSLDDGERWYQYLFLNRLPVRNRKIPLF